MEAESVAYVISAAHGMDSSDESLPYGATWAGSRAPADVVRATAQRVLAPHMSCSPSYDPCRSATAHRQGSTQNGLSAPGA